MKRKLVHSPEPAAKVAKRCVKTFQLRINIPIAPVFTSFIDDTRTELNDPSLYNHCVEQMVSRLIRLYSQNCIDAVLIYTGTKSVALQRYVIIQDILDVNPDIKHNVHASVIGTGLNNSALKIVKKVLRYETIEMLFQNIFPDDIIGEIWRFYGW